MSDEHVTDPRNRYATLTERLEAASLDELWCTVDEVDWLVSTLVADGLRHHPTTRILRAFADLVLGEADRHDDELDQALRAMIDQAGPR